MENLTKATPRSHVNIINPSTGGDSDFNSNASSEVYGIAQADDSQA